MEKQQFIITRGVPGSGKSTWATQWVAQDPFNRVRINRDDIRQELIRNGAAKNKKTDQYYVYDDKGQMDKEFEGQVTNLENSRVRKALQAGKSVITDNTNLSPVATGKLIRNIKQQQKDIAVAVKDFHISYEEAVKRDAGRERKVGPQVIKMMFNRLGPKGEFPHIDGTYPLQKFKRPEKKGQHAIGVDLDGTACDVRKIRHFVQKDEKGRRNFDRFHRDSLFMPPHPAVIEMIKDAQAAGYAIVITTARSSEYAEISQKWLKEVAGITFDNYYSRQKGDFRTDYEVKKELIDKIREDGYDLVRQIDDNPQAIKAFREKGVEVTEVPFGDALPEGEVVKINNLFRTGGCLRCGKPISKGTIGPRCATRG